MSNPEIHIQNAETATVSNVSNVSKVSNDLASTKDEKFSVRYLKKIWSIIRSDYFPFEVIFLIVCLVIGIFNLEEFWVSVSKYFFTQHK